MAACMSLLLVTVLAASTNRAAASVEAENSASASKSLRGTSTADDVPSKEVAKTQGYMEGSCTSEAYECEGPNCCKTNGMSCFEKNKTWAACRPSCAPADLTDASQAWTCRLPFAHPLAQARETYRWPDLVAVCSAGEALVSPQAFYSTYGSSCEEYCMRGAGKVVMPEWSQFWRSIGCDGCGQPSSCPADNGKDAYTGIRCICTFPDRL
eukprot:TRINITY_DN113567_c0_g1_i1.p1 TRINITY_DN113567_c0_g1~~TRINITY_DN113567_c0_g1_i1.p1  ORF type:complete len:237 (+),score=14.50 TRINITY_DN113567_c0_g1_i1:84-713(+)